MSTLPYFMRYVHFLCWKLISGQKKFIKRPYLRKYGESEKSKATLFSQTLKVWEYKVPLVWSILPYLLRYGHFLCWKLIFSQKKFIKRPYLRKYGKSEKSKTTLLYQTFKVWENKVPFVLSILLYFLRYGHFLVLPIFLLLRVKNRNSFHGKLTIPFSNIIIFPYF